MIASHQIELIDIEKRFGDTIAVERMNLAIRPGEFVVLVGPSGCGKTTTLRMIAGLESPSGGRVLIGGSDVTHRRPGSRDIAFVFQMFALYPHLTAEANISFPLRAAGIGRRETHRRTASVMDRLDLQAIRHRKPRTLCGGDQQRVSLARAMVREPKAFLMDEPLGTLDADQRERTRQQLRAIHNELGATTVFVTHDQLEAMGLADRIAVMNQGRLLQFDSPRAVYDHPANLFVAHFIGSPGMNFLAGRRSGNLFLPDAAPHAAIAIPPDVPTDPIAVTLGIRPEYLQLNSSGVDAVVEHTELLGAYNLVQLRVGAASLKMRVKSHQRFAEAERVKVRLDVSGMRWFDSTSGQAITNNRSPGDSLAAI